MPVPIALNRAAEAVVSLTQLTTSAMYQRFRCLSRWQRQGPESDLVGRRCLAANICWLALL
ncbi:hypothetical protein KIN20_023560 [Parelaphostrongylus tenuis]|uniref:Uncharacterized protein n=1 Tax=Parelaphostrongylus tenuis TaxID=148309 RepID=A0AAD5MRV9_PARTN|nr:hypothetical protein KIN20_023560 [Parelaphostrongylus tenuis]